MRVGDGTAFIHHRASGDDWLIDVAHQSVLKGNHHRYGFHHRARLVAQHGVVNTFNVGVFFGVPLQIADGFDFAGGNLHEHARAPFGVHLGEHVQQLLFHDVLQRHVDGGGDVISRHGRCLYDFSHTGSYLHFFRHARCAVEIAVESHLKPRAAVYFAFVVLAHVAYASCSHRAKWLGAQVRRGGVESRVAFFHVQKRESAQAVHIVVGEFCEQCECSAFSCQQLFFNFIFPFIFCFPRAEVC